MSADSMQAFLAAGGSAIIQNRLSALGGNQEMLEMLQVLKGPLAGLKNAGGDLAKALWGLLDIKLADVLVKTWNEAGILKKYLDPENYDADTEVSVTLSEHDMTSEHHPYVDVLLDGVKLIRIVLDVRLEFAFDGIELKIKNARIMRIEPGTCKAKGVVSYRGLLLLEEKSDKLELPGSLEFGNGIPIAP